MSEGQLRLGRKRKIQYIVLFASLFSGYFLLRHSPWVGNKQLHTMMELVATFLSLMVGILALIRYYTRKSNALLFLGTGFLGTSFLDGYHAVVTSTFFDMLWPSPPTFPYSLELERVPLFSGHPDAGKLVGMET